MTVLTPHDKKGTRNGCQFLSHNHNGNAWIQHAMYASAMRRNSTTFNHRKIRTYTLAAIGLANSTNIHKHVPRTQEPFGQSFIYLAWSRKFAHVMMALPRWWLDKFHQNSSNGPLVLWGCDLKVSRCSQIYTKSKPLFVSDWTHGQNKETK